MYKKSNWRRRSILVLIVGTLVLGAVLTGLVIREVEREKLARERDLKREQQRFANLLTGEVDSLFSRVEERILSAIMSAQNHDDINELMDTCRLISSDDEVIGDIFLEREKNQYIYSLRNPGHIASERKRFAALNMKKIVARALFKKAEAAEFTEKNLTQAIQSYRQLFNLVPDDPSRALAANRMARCYLKSGNIYEALKIYKTILSDYPHELSEEGVPLGIFAYSQISVITQKIKLRELEDILLEFLDSLVGSEWTLDRAQFQYYWSRIEKMRLDWIQNREDVKKNTEMETRWQQLERRAENKLRSLAADEDLIEKVIPLVQAKLSEFERESQKFTRFAENLNENLFLVCATTFPDGRILVIHINEKILSQARIPSVLEKLPVPQDWIVQITDLSGGIILGEEELSPGSEETQQPFIAEFAGNFPPWQVRIYPKNPHHIQRQLNTRRNIYILIVVLVTAILFFGGFMIIRSTAKELELAKLKSEFVATVSHEFRTPLMSIRYLSEMLDTGRVREEGKKRDYYGRIHKESERLSRLIENMLDFSKIEAGMKKYKFEQLSIQSLVKDVVDRFNEFMSGKKMNMECDINGNLPEIFADREALSRALFNLLDNAVKYSSGKPEILIKVSCDEENIFLEVHDNGPGIPKEEQKKVLEKFYRSSDPARANIEGSGIGLTLVDHIVKAHGGQLQIESEPGCGTRAKIQIPIFRKGKKDG
jgi:signal transduction histidine kinase/tetratricopeptide (TPR) repeat protein